MFWGMGKQNKMATTVMARHDNNRKPGYWEMRGTRDVHAGHRKKRKRAQCIIPLNLATLRSLLADPQVSPTTVTNMMARMWSGQSHEQQTTMLQRVKRHKEFPTSDPPQKAKPTAVQRVLNGKPYGMIVSGPYPYQVKALRAIAKNEEDPHHGVSGCILAMEMGLGKTLISLLAIVRTWRPGQHATLVVTPKKLVANYVQDAAKFFGSGLRVLLWERDALGDTFFRFNAQTALKNQVIVTSYDTLTGLARAADIVQSKRSNKKLKCVAKIFYAVPWFRVICDESHKFSNHKTQLWQALMSLSPGRRLCLTGTVIRNYEDDLFSQLLFCGLNHPQLQTYNSWTIQNYRDYELGRCVFSMQLRDANIELPPIEVHQDFCTLNEMEKRAYRSYMNECTRLMDQYQSKTVHFTSVLAMFTRLRQICIAAYLLDPRSKPDKKLSTKDKLRLLPGRLVPNGDLEVDEWVRDRSRAGIQSTKMQRVVYWAGRCAPDEKMLIFCQWAGAVLLAEEALIQRFGPDSTTSVTGRTHDADERFHQFRTNPTTRFLVMTRVGSLGLTLTEANWVILVDQDWTDIHNKQSIGRVHRIGQTKPCHVVEIMIDKSIESRLVELNSEKRNLREELLEHGINAAVLARFLGQPEEDEETKAPVYDNAHMLSAHAKQCTYDKSLSSSENSSSSLYSSSSSSTSSSSSSSSSSHKSLSLDNATRFTWASSSSSSMSSTPFRF